MSAHAVMDSACARVPATTSNLGPGFDCLGLALGLSNQVTVRRAQAAAPAPLLAAAGDLFFQAAGVPPFPYTVAVQGDVPPARGLGSSASVRLGTLLSLNRLSGEPLDRQQLFALTARLEGHPDNAAAACFGGFTITGGPGDSLRRHDVDSLVQVVLCVPPFEVRTDRAREALPATYPRADAVANLAALAQVVAAFVSRDYASLRGAFSDRLHQPYRRPLVPFLDAVIAAGTEAGALGGFLSGSGSTIACLSLGDGAAVARAMAAAVPGRDAAVFTVGVDNRGAQLEDP